MRKYLNNKVERLQSVKAAIVCYLLLAFCASSHAQQIKVVEEKSNAPVSYASIFDDATGKVLGLTTSDGAIPVKLSADATISIQHLNYQPVTVKVATIKNDTILVQERNYQVNEVAVNPQKHDYLRMKYYVRQYSILNGMVAQVDESLCYSYHDFKDNTKKPKRQVLSRKVLRDENALKGQKISLQVFATYNNPLDFLNIKVENLNEAFLKKKTNEIRQQEFKDGVKRFTKIVRKDTTSNRIEYIVDSCFVEKPFNIPLLGLSITNVNVLAYLKIHNNQVGLTGLENIVISHRIVHNKTQSFADLYTEIYPLETDYADKKDLEATKDQAKENKKDSKENRKSGAGNTFEQPTNANIPPFSKYIEAAMKNMTEPKEL